MRKFFRAATAALLPSFVVLAVLCSSPALYGDDLSVLLDVYAKDVQEIRIANPTSEERRRFREDWLERLVHGLAENPESPSRRVAVAKAVGLANSTGNWEISNKLTSELSTTSDNSESVFWLVEHGEVSINAYRTSGEKTMRDEGVKALRKGFALAKSSKDVPPDVKMRAVEGGLLLAKTLADTSNVEADDLKDLLSSISKVSNDLPPEISERLKRTGNGAEGIASVQLGIAAKLVRQDLAVVALERLLEMDQAGTLKGHFSSHLLRYAEMAWPDKHADYREFLKRWDSRATEDTWRGYTCFSIMSSAFADKACEDVGLYGDLILGSAGDVLRTSDAEKSGKASYMSETYAMLAECSKSSGMAEKAQQYTDALAVLAPGDLRLKKLKTPPLPTKKPKPLKSRSIGWFTILNILVFVCFLSVFIKKKFWDGRIRT